MSSSTFRERAAQLIRQIDPAGKVVREVDPFTVKYNDKNLVLHRRIGGDNDEEYVRAILLCRLHSELGYPLGALELEQSYSAGRPKVIKPRIDIIVRDRRLTAQGPAFLFIEVKAPDKYDSDQTYIEGQLFRLALLEATSGPVRYLAYYSVDASDYALRDRLIIIDFEKYASYESWEDQGSVSLDTLPRDYG